MPMDIYSDPSISNPSDPHYGDPWCAFMRAMRDAFDGIPEVRQPPGVFPGKNLMADDIVSFHRGVDGRWIEVSYGRGIGTVYIIGLTIRDDSGAPGDVETFDEPAAAADRLRALVEGDDD